MRSRGFGSPSELDRRRIAHTSRLSRPLVRLAIPGPSLSQYRSAEHVAFGHSDLASGVVSSRRLGPRVLHAPRLSWASSSLGYSPSVPSVWSATRAQCLSHLTPRHPDGHRLTNNRQCGGAGARPSFHTLREEDHFQSSDALCLKVSKSTGSWLLSPRRPPALPRFLSSSRLTAGVGPAT